LYIYIIIIIVSYLK